MARAVVVTLVGLAGLLCAAAIGYAAYAVSRSSVAVPVTRLQTRPTGLAPAEVRRKPKPRQRITSTATLTFSTATTDDHGGRDHSGHGGGGDDD
jgi:hypothetical protein